jgi:hypothetical protein
MRSGKNLRHTASPSLGQSRSIRVGLLGKTIGCLAVALLSTPAQAQLIRGSLDSGSGGGLLGTGVTVGTGSAGTGLIGSGLSVNTTGTSGGLLGTGVTVGTTDPGTGLLGTGANLGTTGTGGVLGTGATVGTTGTGTGVLGTGVSVGTTGGGLLGTGVSVGTTNPGGGLLGTGVTVGTGDGGLIGTGIDVCTTGPGGGLLGTGANVNQACNPTNTPTPGNPGNPTPVPGGDPGLPPTSGPGTGTGGLPPTSTGTSGPVTTTDNSINLRLTQVERALSDFPLRGNNGAGRGAPVASGTDSVAAGYGASATGENAAAFGSGASAGAENAVAIGNSANAAHANSVAIGTNARTTRANQVALGTANSTYTMAGVASAASRAAQSGATQFVTTDSSGNLATSGYGPNHIAALDGRVGNLETTVSQLQRDMRGAYQGTAIALALTGAVLPEGKNFAVSTNFGTYRGETGFGASGVARITDNVFVSGGIGLGTSGQTNIAGRGGVTLAW